MKLGESLEIPIFGKKCDFKVTEVLGNQLKSTNSDGFIMKESTNIIIELEKDEKLNKNLEDIKENPSVDLNEICEEIHKSELNELKNVINFNLDDKISECFKLKNIVVSGREQTGKKTLIKRLEKMFFENLNFDFRKFKIEKVKKIFK